jgi:hypothetical protein
MTDWRFLPPKELAERISQIRRLAADPKRPLHLSERIWTTVDRMRTTLAFRRKHGGAPLPFSKRKEGGVIH